MNNVQTCPVRLLMVPRHVKPPEFDYDYEHRFAEHEHEDDTTSLWSWNAVFDEDD